MRKLTHDYFPRNDPAGVEMEMIYIYILVISTPRTTLVISTISTCVFPWKSSRLFPLFEPETIKIISLRFHWGLFLLFRKPFPVHSKIFRSF